MTTLALEQLVDESTFTEAGALTCDVTGRRITGRRVVLEWILRSWLQPRGKNRLAPNTGDDIRELENATLDDRKLEAWRVRLTIAAKAASIGYLASIDVTVKFADRTTSIAARVGLADGSTSSLAVTLASGAAVVKFGGTQ